jgi:DNA-binding SARP family transcriptional activator
VLASSDVTTLEFRVLGPLEVRRNGEVIPIPAPKQRALLGVLLLHANEPVAQDELIDLLWGEDAPPSARASLQNQVHAIRRVLGADVVERQPGGYVVNVEPGRLDLERFEQLVAEARRSEPRERAARLREALACWRGSALVEFPTEPFAQHEIGRLEEERLSAIEDRIDADLSLGLHAEVAGELEGLIERHPLRERLWAQLMLALYRSGRQADAVSTYRRAHRAFADELGIEPGSHLRDLQRAMLAQSPALDQPDYELAPTLERAAPLLAKAPAERVRSLLDYGNALVTLGENRQAYSTFQAAQRMAAAAGERVLEEHALLKLSILDCYMHLQSTREHLDAARRAACVFERFGDKGGLAEAMCEQATILAFSGRCAEGTVAADRAMTLAREVGDPWQEATAAGILGFSLAEGPVPLPEATARCEELVANASADVVPWRVHCALAWLYAHARRAEDARDLATSVLEAARRDGAIRRLIVALECATRVELALGDWAAVEENVRFGHELLEVDVIPGALSGFEAILACLVAPSGNVEEARRLAQSARAKASSGDDFYFEVLWRSALALVNAREGRTDEAILLCGEAVRRANAGDALLFRAKTLEDAATVHDLLGDREGAVRALRLALDDYERKGQCRRFGTPPDSARRDGLSLGRVERFVGGRSRRHPPEPAGLVLPASEQLRRTRRTRVAEVAFDQCA